MLPKWFPFLGRTTNCTLPSATSFGSHCPLAVRLQKLTLNAGTYPGDDQPQLMSNCTEKPPTMQHLSSSVTLVELKRTLVPPNWDAVARMATMPECKEVGLSLAHSFAADDLSLYLVDANDMDHLSYEEKWRLHVDMMTYITSAHLMKGIVTTIGPEYDSVAMW